MLEEWASASEKRLLSSLQNWAEGEATRKRTAQPSVHSKAVKQLHIPDDEQVPVQNLIMAWEMVCEPKKKKKKKAQFSNTYKVSKLE